MLPLTKLSKYIHERKTVPYHSVEDKFDFYDELRIKYWINQIRIGYYIIYKYHNDIYKYKVVYYRNIDQIEVTYTLDLDKYLTIKIGHFNDGGKSFMEINCGSYDFSITFYDPKYIKLLSCLKI